MTQSNASKLTQSEDDGKRAVRETVDKWIHAFNNRDVETLLAIYDPDAVYANDGAALMVGVKQIAPWFEAALGAATATIVFREEALFQSSDMALMVGRFYFRPLSGAESESGETGRVALGLRLDREGAWRMFFDMDNRPPDVKPEDFS